MNFAYTRILRFFKHKKHYLYVPWLYIGIFNPAKPSKVIYPLGLIDSGADTSVIDREIGEELGYEIEKGRLEEIVGVGGGKTIGYLHEVGHLIEDPEKKEKPIKFKGFALFAKYRIPETHPTQAAIFGRTSLFNNTIITFHDPFSISIQSSLN